MSIQYHNCAYIIVIEAQNLKRYAYSARILFLFNCQKCKEQKGRQLLPSFTPSNTQLMPVLARTWKYLQVARFQDDHGLEGCTGQSPVEWMCPNSDAWQYCTTPSAFPGRQKQILSQSILEDQIAEPLSLSRLSVIGHYLIQPYPT